jgi:hypothetical protein
MPCFPPFLPLLRHEEIYVHKFNSAPGCIYLLCEKTYFKVYNSFSKTFYMYIFIICVHSSSFVKNRYFSWST